MKYQKPKIKIIKQLGTTKRELEYRVAMDSPVFGSHSLIGCWASLLPEIIKDL